MRLRFSKEILTLGMALAVLSSPVLAQDAPPAEGAPPPATTTMDAPSPHHDKGEMFKKIDKDGDGFATRSEMESAHKEKLDKMFSEGDTDKDGKLSQDEMKTSFEKMKKKMKERMGERREGKAE